MNPSIFACRSPGDSTIKLNNESNFKTPDLMKTSTEHFDAIVIGTGISGGWAAKELCEQGLKTLVLERGRPVTHITDYPT